MVLGKADLTGRQRMDTAASVLVIEDEPAMRRLLRTSLGAQGHPVIEAATGAEALTAIRHHKPDLVLLDLGLPDIDGVELIGRIRELSAAPILVLSSRSGERDKVQALDLGADDYVTKPFGIDELLARMRTALRHRVQQQGGVPVVTVGALTIDLVHRLVALAGERVKLSPTEYDILHLLAIHAGNVLTHRQILAEVWGPARTADTQYLRVYVRSLRQKLEPEPARPVYILTEPGVGYRLQTRG